METEQTAGLASDCKRKLIDAQFHACAQTTKLNVLEFYCVANGSQRCAAAFNRKRISKCCECVVKATDTIRIKLSHLHQKQTSRIYVRYSDPAFFVTVYD